MSCTKLAGGALGPPDKGRSSRAEGMEGHLDLDIAGAWEIFKWCGLGLWRRERPATESGSTWQLGEGTGGQASDHGGEEATGKVGA